MTTVTPNQPRAYAFGMGAVICWSTVATAFKLSLEYLSPAQLLLYASLTSWLFLAIILLVKKHGNIRKIKPFKEYTKVFIQQFINSL